MVVTKVKHFSLLEPDGYINKHYKYGKAKRRCQKRDSRFIRSSPVCSEWSIEDETKFNGLREVFSARTKKGCASLGYAFVSILNICKVHFASNGLNFVAPVMTPF